MCNLHDEVPKEDLERFVRKHLRELWLPGLGPSYAVKPVGPFGTGLFLKLEGKVLHGVVGQWGLIRPGQLGRVDYIQPKAVPGKKPLAPRPRSTNNARIEGIKKKPTFSKALPYPVPVVPRAELGDREEHLVAAQARRR